MLSATEARDLIDTVFEEQAVALGGLLAVHRVEDELVRSLVRILDAIRDRALARATEGASSDCTHAPRPHPAIREFLARLGREEPCEQ